MKNTLLMAACVLSLSAVPALAQPSQGKMGSDNGPASNSATTNDTGSGTTGSSRGDARSREGTSGMVGAGSGAVNPSSSGNVGPGTNNNSGKQPGGR
jgi:hypothetical protein